MTDQTKKKSPFMALFEGKEETKKPDALTQRARQNTLNELRKFGQALHASDPVASPQQTKQRQAHARDTAARGGEEGGGAGPAAKKSKTTKEKQSEEEARKIAVFRSMFDSSPLFAKKGRSSTAKKAAAKAAAEKKHLVFCSDTIGGTLPYNQGQKPNQDRCTALAPFPAAEAKKEGDVVAAAAQKIGFFGVYDGHGPLGHEVSEYVAKHLHTLIDAAKLHPFLNPAHDTAPLHALITEAFTTCHTNMSHEQSGVDCSQSGTTAAVCIAIGGRLFACNVGDSRIVLGQKIGSLYRAVPLSTDQTPKDDAEKTRLEAAGARVEPRKNMQGKPFGPPRVWFKDSDTPGLAVSRSIGDGRTHAIGVTAEPVIVERSLALVDAFIILASDGVWEFMTDEEAVQIIGHAPSFSEGVKKLVRTAQFKWSREIARDDITAVVVALEPKVAASASAAGMT